MIEEVDEEGYKYLGIQERYDICKEKMKRKIFKRKILNESGQC